MVASLDYTISFPTPTFSFHSSADYNWTADITFALPFECFVCGVFVLLPMLSVQIH